MTISPSEIMNRIDKSLVADEIRNLDYYLSRVTKINNTSVTIRTSVHKLNEAEYGALVEQYKEAGWYAISYLIEPNSSNGNGIWTFYLPPKTYTTLERK